jgi:DNA-binding XRE family transcriptional regulator
MSKSPKQKKDVNERWTNDGMTQNEVAEALGMKRQTVNHIEKTALRKVTSKLNRLYKKEDLL